MVPYLLAAPGGEVNLIYANLMMLIYFYAFYERQFSSSLSLEEFVLLKTLACCVLDGVGLDSLDQQDQLGQPGRPPLNFVDINSGLTSLNCSGLADMCDFLFQIPEEMSRCRNSYMEQGLSPMRMEVLVENCGTCNYKNLLRDGMDALLKEGKDKFKGYDTCSTPENAELAYKKVRNDFIQVIQVS